MRKGIEYFEGAIAEDADYALAYAGLADCHALLGSGGYGGLGKQEEMSKATAAAVKALEINDTLAEAHTSLAFVKFRFDWDWSGAEIDFQRAIELNPNYPTAHQWYALYLMVRGRSEEAIGEIRRAQELDPLSLTINAGVGRLFHLARQYDKAIEQIRKTLELDPNFVQGHYDLGMAYGQMGMHKEAIRESKEAISLSADHVVMVAALGYAYALAGKKKEALKVLEELNKRFRQRHVPPTLIAFIYAGLAEKDKAFEWLEKAYEEHNDYLPFLGAEPAYDPLRADPRFQDLLRRMNFPL